MKSLGWHRFTSLAPMVAALVASFVLLANSSAAQLPKRIEQLPDSISLPGTQVRTPPGTHSLPIEPTETGVPTNRKAAIFPTAIRTGPFRALDNIEGDHIDLNFMAVRPMALAPDGLTLWAINAHGSKVVGFIDLSGVPANEYDVPWGPVSIAYWVSPSDGHEELLVVSRGTYGLTRLDPTTGATLGYLPLPPEPADLLVLGDQAFVSTSAFDEVVQIDLPSNAIVHRFQVESSRHLMFLSDDGQGNVLVTPMISGNNTMPKRSGVAGFAQSDPLGTVLDMSDPDVAEIGLPDEDVFRLIPATGAVEVVATGVGTNLFAHAFNAGTGQLWVLNTEARNADPSKNSEPELQGIFIEDRLTLVDLPAPGAAPKDKADHTYVDLTGFSQAIGNPYALHVTSTNFGVLTGLLTDNVSIVTANGGEVATWALPEGSIPRGVHFDENLLLIYVYCWGTNKIEVHALAPNVPKIADLDLGYDPTSAERKRGRAVFFDGANSTKGNASCYSCHIEVEADFLVWNIEDDPIDRKRVMRTQSLKGIAPTGPYHWRGERQFLDFNPAFDGLLGGKQLSNADFKDFRAYVFGVENPANPFEHPRRIVTNDTALTRFDTFSFPVQSSFLDAVAGQDTYFDELTVGTATCQDCHTLPTGTDNDFFLDGAFDTGHCNTFVVPAYNGLWRKEQRRRVTVQEKGRAAEVRAPLGSGTTHAGLIDGLFEFVVETGFAVPREERENIALFMHQVDQGLAPAVHKARRSWIGASAQAWLEGYLMPQAMARNCDVAVFGTVDVGSGPRRARWYWERRGELFVPDDPVLAPQGLGFFIAQATAGTGDNLFVGLPVGMSERWAVDYDGDELSNGEERALGLDPNEPDWDGDGFLDGTEVTFGGNAKEEAIAPVPTTGPTITSVNTIYTTARVAKYIVETNVPTTLQVDYTSNHGDSGSLSLDHLAKNHTVLLRDLDPSNLLMGIDEIYDGKIRAIDEFGATTETSLPTTKTEPFVSAAQDPGLVPLEVVARQLDLVSVESRGFQRFKKKAARHLGWDFEYDVRIDDRRLAAPAPLANHVVIARVHVNREPVPAESLLMNGGPVAPFIVTELSANFLYGGFGGFGPFIVGSVSDASGISRLSFSVLNAAPGDEVTLSLEVIGQPFDPNAFLPTIPILALHSLFDLPNTPTAFRAHTVKL